MFVKFLVNTNDFCMNNFQVGLKLFISGGQCRIIMFFIHIMKYFFLYRDIVIYEFNSIISFLFCYLHNYINYLL